MVMKIFVVHSHNLQRCCYDVAHGTVAGVIILFLHLAAFGCIWLHLAAFGCIWLDGSFDGENADSTGKCLFD
jgi:hypothetical protein